MLRNTKIIHRRHINIFQDLHNLKTPTLRGCTKRYGPFLCFKMKIWKIWKDSRYWNYIPSRLTISQEISPNVQNTLEYAHSFKGPSKYPFILGGYISVREWPLQVPQSLRVCVHVIKILYGGCIWGSICYLLWILWHDHTPSVHPSTNNRQIPTYSIP